MSNLRANKLIPFNNNDGTKRDTYLKMAQVVNVLPDFAMQGYPIFIGDIPKEHRIAALDHIMSFRKATYPAIEVTIQNGKFGGGENRIAWVQQLGADSTMRIIHNAVVRELQ